MKHFASWPFNYSSAASSSVKSVSKERLAGAISAFFFLRCFKTKIVAQTAAATLKITEIKIITWLFFIGKAPFHSKYHISTIIITTDFEKINYFYDFSCRKTANWKIIK